MATSPSGVFKKFNPAESIAQLAHTKGSDQRKARQELEEQYPLMKDHWETLMPKKQEIMVVRCHDGITIIALLPDPEFLANNNGAIEAAQNTATSSIDSSRITKPLVLFFQHFGGKFIPHLRVQHQYPDHLVVKYHQVDIGGWSICFRGLRHSSVHHP